MSNPTIEGPLGNPPFEKPSIAKVSLFFYCKETVKGDNLKLDFHLQIMLLLPTTIKSIVQIDE